MVKNVNTKRNNFNGRTVRPYERKNNFNKEFHTNTTYSTSNTSSTNIKNYSTDIKNYSKNPNYSTSNTSYNTRGRKNYHNNYKPRRNTSYPYKKQSYGKRNTMNTNFNEYKYTPFKSTDTHLTKPVELGKPDYSIEALKKYIDKTIDENIDTVFFEYRRYSKTQKIKKGAVTISVEISPRYNPKLKRSLMIIINKDKNHGLYNMTICNGGPRNLNILFMAMEAYLIPKVEKYLPSIIHSTEKILREQIAVYNQSHNISTTYNKNEIGKWVSTTESESKDDNEKK